MPWVRNHRPRSPHWVTLGAAAAIAGAAVRWWLQGSGNVYTDLGRGFYVPDPDLGWRLLDDGPMWLGLDSLLALGLAAVVVAVTGWWIARRARPVVAWLRWLVAAAMLMVPAAAFATGFGPAERRDHLPVGLVQPPSSGISGSLPGLPSGLYRVASGPTSFVVATLRAGGETFEARFGKVEGTWRAAPGDLRQPMTAEVRIDARTVDTGIGLRSRSAYDDLQADAYPQIVFRLTGLEAARQDEAALVAFRARGTLDLIGRTHEVAVTGTVRALDAAAGERLDVDGAALLVRASFVLLLEQTAMGHDGTFDSDEIPLGITLVMTHAKE
jgi:polyisoprenoid-binding protein YceI